MKTSILNGINTSSLNWDFFITLNRMKRTSINQWENEMNRIMDENTFHQLYWSCEKSKSNNGIYHTHILIDSNNKVIDRELVDYFTKYLVKGKEISYKSSTTTAPNWTEPKMIDGKKIIYDLTTNQNKRLLEYKSCRNLIGPNGLTIKKEVIEREFIPFHEIQGTDGRGYIERVRGVRNASIYLNKFTDRGITTGYLNQNRV